MKCYYLLLLFFLIPSVSANSFGVSPSQIEMQGSSEFYVINSNNFQTKFKLMSEVVNFEKEEFYLEPLEKIKIKINQKSKQNGVIEVLSGENLVSSLQIPITFKETVSKNSTIKQILINEEKETKGLFLIIIFNTIGLTMGVLVWKKKIFWPSQ